MRCTASLLSRTIPYRYTIYMSRTSQKGEIVENAIDLSLNSIKLRVYLKKTIQ